MYVCYSLRISHLTLRWFRVVYVGIFRHKVKEQEDETLPNEKRGECEEEEKEEPEDEEKEECQAVEKEECEGDAQSDEESDESEDDSEEDFDWRDRLKLPFSSRRVLK